MYFCFVHSLWKCQLKNLFHSGDIFERKPLNTPIARCGAMFKSGYFCKFVIDVFWKILKSLELFPVFAIVTSRKMFSFWNSIVYCIDWSWLFGMSKNYNDCSLVLDLAWLSSRYLLKVFGGKFRLRASVIDMCSIL